MEIRKAASQTRKYTNLYMGAAQPAAPGAQHRFQAALAAPTGAQGATR